VCDSWIGDFVKSVRTGIVTRMTDFFIPPRALEKLEGLSHKKQKAKTAPSGLVKDTPAKETISAEEGQESFSDDDDDLPASYLFSPNCLRR
jgi:hypothetical protein